MKQSIFQQVYRRLLGHPIARWVVVIGSLVYLISPLDIVPDVIPIFGWVDDGVLATLLATGVVEIVLEQRRARKNQGADQNAPTLGSDDPTDA